MGLIELCLLSLLSPQQPDAQASPAADVSSPAMAAQDPVPVAAPAPTPAPTGPAPTTGPSAEPTPTEPAGSAESPQPSATATTTATTTEQTGTDDQDDPRARLIAAEAAGDDVDGDELLALAACDDAEVAARAAWLIAHSTRADISSTTSIVARKSPHRDARLVAMQALLRAGEVTSTTTGLDALGDEDRRVRTVAAKLLGKLRRPTAVEPLIGMIDTVAETTETGPATDVQAALLTLADLGATPHLLRMATAIHDGNVEGTGTALAYAFQTLTPTMEAAAETTLLVAVLDHREPLLRRYAITRLAELGSKTAAASLEGRLAIEGPELRPLVEVALGQIRQDDQKPPSDEMERALTNTKALWAKAQARWRTLEPTEQGIVAGVPIVLLLLVWMLRRSAKRRAANAEAMATISMVAPSDDYEEYDEYEEDGDYDGEGDIYAEGDEEHADQYEESDWQADEEEILFADGPQR